MSSVINQIINIPILRAIEGFNVVAINTILAF